MAEEPGLAHTINWICCRQGTKRGRARCWVRQISHVSTVDYKQIVSTAILTCSQVSVCSQVNVVSTAILTCSQVNVCNVILFFRRLTNSLHGFLQHDTVHSVAYAAAWCQFICLSFASCIKMKNMFSVVLFHLR